MENTALLKDCPMSESIVTSVDNEVQQHHHGDDAVVSDAFVVGGVTVRQLVLF